MTGRRQPVFRGLADRRKPPDWLIVGQEMWDEVERRNQLLVRAQARRHPGARFLFAETPLRPRNLAQWRAAGVRRIERNIWAVRAVRPLPAGRLSWLSDRLEALQLRRAMRLIGIERPALWTQDPRTAELVEHLEFGPLVYDLTDDWVAFEADPSRRALVQDQVERLARRADLVLACSRALEQTMRPYSEMVRYLPNAVEPGAVTGPTPPDIARLPRPRLGYVGTLHGARLDVELLATAIAMRPAWSFVFLGPNHLSAAEEQQLLAPDNAHYLGIRPHADVREYMQGLDIGLLPHRVTAFTRSLDPLKLYEYLAAGLPVVVTDVENAPELRSHVAVVRSAEELVARCEDALEGNTPSLAEARRGAVAGATWDARAAELDSWLGVEPEADLSPGVSVVIVSFNTRELLARCLRAVCEQTYRDVDVIVVDNGSTDGSQDLVRTSFPEVELIELGENVGFAPANNIAFARCRREFTLLLNSDAFLDSEALAELVETAARHPSAGAVGARLLNADGSLQRSAWPFPHGGRMLLEAFGLHRPLRALGLISDLGTWDHDQERTVDFLIGACLLVRTRALAEVDGFDEDFWLYAEEADLQKRLATRGWVSVLAPGATATHLGSASSTASTARLRNFYAGQRRFLLKHGTPLGWPAARLALLVGSLLRGRGRTALIALRLTGRR